MEMRAPERCPAKASRLRAEPRDWRPLTQRGGGGGGQAASLLGKLAPAGTLEPRAGPCGALCASPAAWLWSPPLQGPSHVTSLSRPRQDPPQREDGKGVLPEPSWNSERDQGPWGDVRAAEEGSVDSAKRPEGATWDDRIHGEWLTVPSGEFWMTAGQAFT